MNKIINTAFSIIKITFTNKYVPVYYFNDVKNIGDTLNEDLVQMLSTKKVLKFSGMRYFKHLTAIGSVLTAMNRKSIVWGSGFISHDAIKNIKELGDIRAVRGHYTKAKLEEKFNISLQVPLGDPALLTPLMYKAEKTKKYKLGLILHYVDKHHNIGRIVEQHGGKVIDVSLKPKDFIKELTSCEVILSSSMHGLILSDAYLIPNTRLILSDAIVGGDFKFLDYYSTTDNPNPENMTLSEKPKVENLKIAIQMATVKNYKYNLKDLEGAFPSEFSN